MRAIHISVYRVRGISPGSAEPAREVINAPDLSFSAFLTQDLEDRSALAWKRVAIANGVLNGIFRAEGGDLEDRVEAEVTKELERARARFGSGPFLVFTREGEVDDFECAAESSRNKFDVGIDGPIPHEFGDMSAQLVKDALTALSIEIPAVTGFDEVTGGVTYFREDKRPFFAFRITMGARVEALERVDYESWSNLERATKKVSEDDTLVRVHRLLSHSLEQDGDRLRAFLSAWFGLEVLVGKIFPAYEKTFFAHISTRRQAGNAPHHVHRIREVMKDKYRLTDKFSMIATELAEDSVDADLATFRRCKGVRDKLLHGQDVRDSGFPVAETSRLLRRYLSLHLGFNREGEVDGGEP